MKSLSLLAVLGSLILMAGCANPTYTSQRDGFTPENWKTVAIMPFGGDSRFADGATQAFAIHVLNVPGFTIIQPSQLSISVRELGIFPTEDGYTVIEAQKVGQAVNADAVIIGTVSSYKSSMTLNGFCTAQIIDVASGQIVGASHNPSGLLVGNSEHQCVMAATERTAKEILRILADLNRKNRIPTEAPDPAPARSVEI